MSADPPLEKKLPASTRRSGPAGWKSEAKAQIRLKIREMKKERLKTADQPARAADAAERDRIEFNLLTALEDGEWLFS